MNGEKSRTIKAIREYISAKNLSREQFAHRAKVSISLLNKMLAGDFTDKGLAKVESNTGVRFRSHNIIRKQAPEYLGSYSYDDCHRYEGFYELIRRSFQEEHIIHSYAMEIKWSEESACLAVRHLGIKESQFRQFGLISMPESARYFFIQSQDRGWHSLAIMSKLDFSRIMYGALYSLGDVGTQGFLPMAVPIVIKGAGNPTETKKIDQSSPDYEVYAKLLSKVRTDKYVSL